MSGGQKEPEFQDTACHHCFRMSCGIAYRDGEKRWSPLRFVCEKCAAELDMMMRLGGLEAALKLSDVRDFDRIEIKALEGGVDAVAKFLHDRGVTDLEKLEPIDARMIVKYAVEGFGNELRYLAKKAAEEKERRNPHEND